MAGVIFNPLLKKGLQKVLDIANNSITNLLLAQMPANSVKVNNTNSTQNAIDLQLTVNTVLGREDTLNSGNLTSIPLQFITSAKTTLIAGTRTITDIRITTLSYGIVTFSNIGISTSTPIKFTANNGNMVFNTGQITDTGEFAYLIFF